jgi:hypothetical protein
MLRDGKFIKEDPPKIGYHYVPQFYQSVKCSEPTVEYKSRWGNVYDKYMSSIDVGAWIILFYAAIGVALTVLRAVFDWLVR